MMIPRYLRRLLAPSLACLLLPDGRLSAQSNAADRTTVRRLVDSAAGLVAANYVVPDTGRLVAEHLRRRLASGAYDRPMSLAQLADFLTQDMRTVNGDLHLYARYLGPAAASAAPAAANGPRMVAVGPAGPGGGTGPTTSGPVMRRPGAPSTAALEAARRENFNLHRADHLEGNVGYLQLSLVSGGGSDEAFRVVDAAMAFLERADAMIIDLRRTPGGDPRMSDYIASYFFGPDSVATLTSYRRAGDMTWRRFTHAVPGRTRPDVPVFVLVGPGSASGAEDLAFIFKQTGRGTLVGERTAGAGRLNNQYPAGDGMLVSVSGGRTIDPRTNAEWERVGIQPDVAVPVDDALVAAHGAALARLATAAADPARRRTLEWTREILLANRTPQPVRADALAAFAGTYDLRVITAANGQLYFQRDATRPRDRLVSLGGAVFALGSSTKVEFERQDGRVTALRVLTPDGQVASFPRAPAGR